MPDKSETVTVVCPTCRGTGRVYSASDPIKVGTGEANEYVKCYMCKGARVITAEKS